MSLNDVLEHGMGIVSSPKACIMEISETLLLPSATSRSNGDLERYDAEETRASDGWWRTTDVEPYLIAFYRRQLNPGSGHNIHYY